jgi:hypothetical protein
MAIRSASSFLYFQLLLHPLPLYNALPPVFDPAFRHLHFRLKAGRKFGQSNCLCIQTPRKRAELSPVFGALLHPQQVSSETLRWLVIPGRGLFTDIAIVGAVGSKENGKLHVPLRRADFGL